MLDADGAEDITAYINEDTVPNWDNLLDSVKNPFIEDGKVYGIGYAGYTMGLVIPEPPNAQAIYAVLDGPMGAVLTNPNADIDALLADAQAKVQSILDGDA